MLLPKEKKKRKEKHVTYLLHCSQSHNRAPVRIFITESRACLMSKHCGMAWDVIIITPVMAVVVFVSVLIVVVRRWQPRRLRSIVGGGGATAMVLVIVVVCEVIIVVMVRVVQELPQLRPPTGTSSNCLEYFLLVRPSGDRHLLHSHVDIYVVHSWMQR